MEFEFSYVWHPWEMALTKLPEGASVSAARLLALLEGEEEEEVQAALEYMEKQRIALDAGELPAISASGELEKRLQLEKQLCRSGRLLEGLEENDPLALYLQELAGIPAAGDEALLAERCAAGDASARELLVNLLLSLAVEEAKAQAGRGVLLIDLIQEGSLGLWQGVLCYEDGDIRQHCLWWIRQYQAKALLLQARECGTGEKLRENIKRYRNADRQLLSRLGRNPLPQEIAEYMQVTLEDVLFLEKLFADASEQQRNHPQEEAPQEEDQAVENTAYYQSRQRIRELLSGISPEEGELLSLRYGLEGEKPLDPGEVAKRLGLTPEEVVKREAEALARLRNQ